MIDLPKPIDYWARPPKSEFGDAKKEKLFAAVGEALTEWESAELGLAQLFAFFVESNSLAAIRAYGSIVSAGGRRDSIRAASRYFFVVHSVAESYVSDFNTLMERAEKASGRRNEIAHGMVTWYDTDPEPRRMFLVPPDYNTNRVDVFGKEFGEDWLVGVTYRYTSADIEAFSAKFREFRGAVYTFSRKFAAEYFRVNQAFGNVKG